MFKKHFRTFKTSRLIKLECVPMLSIFLSSMNFQFHSCVNDFLAATWFSIRLQFFEVCGVHATASFPKNSIKSHFVCKQKCIGIKLKAFG